MGNPNENNLRANVEEMVRSITPGLEQRLFNYARDSRGVKIKVDYVPENEIRYFMENCGPGRPINLVIMIAQDRAEKIIRGIISIDPHLMPMVLSEMRPEKEAEARLFDINAIIIVGEQMFTSKNIIQIPTGPIPVPMTFPQLASELMLNHKMQSAGKIRAGNQAGGGNGQESDKRFHHRDFTKIMMAFGAVRKAERREQGRRNKIPLI